MVWAGVDHRPTHQRAGTAFLPRRGAAGVATSARAETPTRVYPAPDGGPGQSRQQETARAELLTSRGRASRSATIYVADRDGSLWAGSSWTAGGQLVAWFRTGFVLGTLLNAAAAPALAPAVAV